MTQLAIYLISMALIVLGALAFIAALKIPGRFRMALACLAACVPALAGVWIFRASGIKAADFNQLLRAAAADIQRITHGLQETKTNRRTLQELLEPIRGTEQKS